MARKLLLPPRKVCLIYLKSKKQGGRRTFVRKIEEIGQRKEDLHDFVGHPTF